MVHSSIMVTSAATMGVHKPASRSVPAIPVIAPRAASPIAGPPRSAVIA